MTLVVRPGPCTGELRVSGLASYEGRPLSYVLSFAEARDLARKLLTVAGTPDRELGPEDLRARVERLDNALADLARHPRQGPEREAALGRLEAEGALVLEEHSGL